MVNQYDNEEQKFQSIVDRNIRDVAVAEEYVEPVQYHSYQLVRFF